MSPTSIQRMTSEPRSNLIIANVSKFEFNSSIDSEINREQKDKSVKKKIEKQLIPKTW